MGSVDAIQPAAVPPQEVDVAIRPQGNGGPVLPPGLSCQLVVHREGQLVEEEAAGRAGAVQVGQFSALEVVLGGLEPFFVLDVQRELAVGDVDVGLLAQAGIVVEIIAPRGICYDGGCSEGRHGDEAQGQDGKKSSQEQRSKIEMN